jgi:hypothetical protein
MAAMQRRLKMIELVLVACLLKDPARCESRQLATEPMSLIECMVTGQQYLMRWTEENPHWRVRRWSCGYPRA